MYNRSKRCLFITSNLNKMSFTIDIHCAGNGPTPLSLQRLASCLQSVVSLLECPVCLETIPPPAFQCCNGHTLCSGCRSLTDRCPVCRVALGPRGRCLLADKLHLLFSATFLQPASRKQKRSKGSRHPPKVDIPTRLKPRIVPVSQSHYEKSEGFSYPCPLDSCETLIKGPDLLSHLQCHEGPLVQYYCKDSSVFLRFPVTRLTVFSLVQGPTFLLQVCPHPTAPCLLLWLYAAPEDAASYRLQVDLPHVSRPIVSPCIFPLSWSRKSIVHTAADRCLVLNDSDFDPSCTKVRLTLLPEVNSMTVL